MLSSSLISLFSKHKIIQINNHHSNVFVCMYRCTTCNSNTKGDTMKNYSTNYIT